MGMSSMSQGIQDRIGTGRVELRGQNRLQRLAMGFFGLVALTFLLIVLGALVRARGAGLACPDWPLCFGSLVPEFDVLVAFEWTHRLVAGGVSLIFLILAVSVLRETRARAVAARMLALGAVVLGIQILLGALTVWQLLASWTVTSHLLAGNTFAVVLLIIARCLREEASPRDRSGPALPSSLAPVLCLTALLLILQIALGGLVSSRVIGLACPEWPSCMNGGWFPSFQGPQGIHLLHRMNGYALVVILGAAATVARGLPVLSGLLLGTFVLCCAQVALGVANVLLRLPMEITGLHTGLATALAMCMALALREAWLRR
jgi:cytochrome c oxidase assembly protein subunit 15